MIKLTQKDLLDAGVHFGHLTKRWNPNMAPFIFMKKKGIHIIDLNNTLSCLYEAADVLKSLAVAGKKIMFVATKRQGSTIVQEVAERLTMPYVTERWLGGMLTNFITIRKSVKKMSSMDKLMQDIAYQNFAKKERLMIARRKIKLKKDLKGIFYLTRLPAALFIIDIKKEHTAVTEAKKLGIPTFALVDTNVNPESIDYPIPCNDDSAKAITLMMKAIESAVAEGLEQRKQEKTTANSTNDTLSKPQDKK